MSKLTLPQPTIHLSMIIQLRNYICFFCIFIFNIVAAQSQQVNSEINETSKADESSYCKFSIAYLSNSVYYGRKDSAVVPYATPTFRYTNKTGLYAEASLSYLSNSESRIDLGYIGAGYKVDNKDSTVELEVYANKYFTNSSSYSVKSALKADAGAGVSLDAGFLKFNVELYSIFSAKTDFTTSFGIEKDVNFGEDENWTFSPSAMVGIGTSNFYSTYFKDKKFSVKRKKRTPVVPAGTVITVNVEKQKIGLLDYELSAPLEYESKRFGFFLTPVYVVPVNPVKYTINNSAPITEKLTNSFFVEIGAFIKF